MAGRRRPRGPDDTTDEDGDPMTTGSAPRARRSRNPISSPAPNTHASRVTETSPLTIADMPGELHERIAYHVRGRDVANFARSSRALAQATNRRSAEMQRNHMTELLQGRNHTELLMKLADGYFSVDVGKFAALALYGIYEQARDALRVHMDDPDVEMESLRSIEHGMRLVDYLYTERRRPGHCFAYVCAQGCVQILRMMLEDTDATEWTPPMPALWGGVKVADDTWRPLRLAILRGHTEAAHYLMNAVRRDCRGMYLELNPEAGEGHESLADAIESLRIEGVSAQVTDELGVFMHEVIAAAGFDYDAFNEDLARLRYDGGGHGQRYLQSVEHL